jgi:hypothetical protein
LKKCKPLAVVEDGFCLFLKLDKLHHDLAKPPLVSPQRLHYNWNDFELCMIFKKCAKNKRATNLEQQDYFGLKQGQARLFLAMPLVVPIVHTRGKW